MSTYIVRYGIMRNLGVMNVRGDESYRRGMEVVIRSNRGLEVGQVLCETKEDTLSHMDDPPTGQLLRELSPDDAIAVSRLEAARQNKIDLCQQHVDRLELKMSLVNVEQLFGGERLIIYYLAEDRVDFRQLVKDLASEFQTRIEMKQIGVRDEAKLLADYGDCGKPVCCNNHLVTMPPVSMKMAKLQKATLDPTKISGRCGRLKCCLRYEFDHYEEVHKQLPKIGSHVVTSQGRGKVLGQEILAEQLLVEMEDHRRILIDSADILTVLKKSDLPQKGKPDSGSKDSRKKENEFREAKTRERRTPRPQPDQQPKKEETSAKKSSDENSNDGDDAVAKKKRSNNRRGRRRGRSRGKQNRDGEDNSGTNSENS